MDSKEDQLNEMRLAIIKQVAVMEDEGLLLDLAAQITIGAEGLDEDEKSQVAQSLQQWANGETVSWEELREELVKIGNR